MDKVNELKDAGNSALAGERYDEAITCYTSAIALDPTNHVLHSNRSAAHAKRGDYAAALQDAEKTIQLNPNWSKGYSRKGSALAYLGRTTEALAAYDAGLRLEPGNAQLQAAAEEVRRQSQRHDSLFAKLHANPTTRQWLDDPEYLAMVQELQANPQSLRIDPMRLQDKRMLTTLSVMLDLDLQAGDAEMPSAPSPPAKASAEPAPASPSQSHLSENKQRAVHEKELGNECYKRKEFASALEHYSKALEHDPTDITYHNNIAAVHFEQKDYERCIKECERAIDVGRENRADFKLIAKAFTRIGNAYKKMEQWKLAKTYYEKSMSEHRTPEIKSLLSDCDARIREAEKKEYVDPVRAEQEKELGNKLFKQGDYSTAIKHYTEAVRRNPDDPKLYSNRAACYTKLAAFDLGLKDCDTCVRLDPKFIKGWIRKGKILQGMQQPGKALSAYQKALELDADNAEALEGYRACSTQVNADPEEVRKRAMADPDVQAILRDPAMRCILDQMQQDPHALSEHLRNPDIAAKIHKLLESGLIAIH